jgi:hypothetical protein
MGDVAGEEEEQRAEGDHANGEEHPADEDDPLGWHLGQNAAGLGNPSKLMPTN